MILYMYIAPGQGLITFWGRNFDANRNILSLRSFVTSFTKISLKSDYIYIFKSDFIYIHIFMLLYIYIAPSQRQTATRRQTFDVNRHVFSLSSFVAS